MPSLVDSSGNVFDVDAAHAQDLLDEGGYSVASAADKQAWAAAPKTAAAPLTNLGLTLATGGVVNGGLPSAASAATFGEAAAAGLEDAAIAPVKLLGLTSSALVRAQQSLGLGPSQAERSAQGRALADWVLRSGGNEALARDLREATETGDPIGVLLSRISGRQLLADTAGVVRAAGDISKADELGAEYDAAARQRAIDNPNAALGGSIAGALAGAAVTGGGLTGLATKSTGLAARLGLAAADGALGGIGAADESAWLAGNGRAKAEDLVAGMGMGAILGGGFGALGEGGSALWGRVMRGSGTELGTTLAPDAARILRGEGAKLAEAGEGAILKSGEHRLAAAVEPLTEQAAGLYAKGVKAVLGLGDEEAEAVKRGLTSRAFRDVVADPAAAAKRAASVLGDDLEHVSATVEKNLETFRELRRPELEAAFARGGGLPEQELVARTKQRLLDAADQFDRVLGEADANVQTVGKASSDLMRERAASITNKTDAFLAQEEAKRQLQNVVLDARSKLANGGLKNATRREQTAALFGTANSPVESLQNALRTNLEDVGEWGAAGAAQAERNQAVSRLLAVKEDAEKLFERQVSSDTVQELSRREAEASGAELTKDVGRYATGRKKLGLVDEDKFAQTLLNSGKAENSVSDKLLDAYLDNAAQLTAAVEKHGNGVVDAEATSAAIKRLQANRSEYLDSIRSFNKLQEAQEKGGASYLRTLGDSAALAGGVIAGAPGAAIGGALGLAARAATDPTGAIRAIARIDELGGLVNRRIGVGVKDILKVQPAAARAASSGAAAVVRGSQARVSQAVRKGASTGLVRFATKPGQSASEAYADRASEVERLAADPAALAEHASGELSDLGQHLPQLTGELFTLGHEAVQFLASKQPAPSREQTVFGGSQVVVSDREAEKWGRYWTATTDPLSVLQLARVGAVEPEHIEALRTLYPSLHARIQAEMVQNIKAGKVPYSARCLADSLLGLGGAGEPSLDPQAQLSRSLAAQNQQPKGKPQRNTPPRIGQDSQSNSQSVWGK